MKSSLMEDFCRISKYAGMREDLVQAGGGNSSVKISEREMLIKASGYFLSEMNGRDGYAVVDYKRAIKFVSMEEHSYTEKEMLKEILYRGEKPSIEVFLHALMKQYTLHTHPLVVNILTSRKNWRKDLKSLFPDAAFVSYATPGIELARVCLKQIKENDADIVFLQNHGLIVSGKTAEEVIKKNENVIRKIQEYLGKDVWDERDSCTLAEMLYSSIPNFDQIVYQTKDVRIYNILNSDIAWKDKMAVSPDATVYCGEKVLVLRENICEEIQHYYESYGMPTVIWFGKQLYIVAENVKKAMEIQSLLAFILQTVWHNKEKEMNLLSAEEQKFLRGWDAEKYRRSKK